MNGWVWGIAVVIAVAVCIGACYTGRPIRAVLGGAWQGACALAAVNVTGMFTGVSLGVNTFTLLTCTLTGVPGVITVLLMKVIFAI